MWLDFLSLASSSLDLLDLRWCSWMLRESLRESLQSPHRYAYPWEGIYSGSGSCPLASSETGQDPWSLINGAMSLLRKSTLLTLGKPPRGQGTIAGKATSLALSTRAQTKEASFWGLRPDDDVIMLGRPWFEFELRPYFGARPFLMRTPSYLRRNFANYVQLWRFWWRASLQLRDCRSLVVLFAHVRPLDLPEINTWTTYQIPLSLSLSKQGTIIIGLDINDWRP